MERKSIIKVYIIYFQNTFSFRNFYQRIVYYTILSYQGTGQGDIQGPPLCNFCLNFAAFMAETNKAISHGVVLHNKSKEVGEKVVLDTDYADDIAIMYNSRDGLQ